MWFCEWDNQMFEFNISDYEKMIILRKLNRGRYNDDDL